MGSLARPDRRRLIGLMLIVGAALAGWFAMSSGSQQTAWITTRSVAAGAPLSEADPMPTTVSVPPESDVVVDQPAPDGQAALDLPEGTLIAGHLVARAGAEPIAAVTLPVPAGHLPEGLRTGDAVDVWSVADGQLHQELDHARVLAVAMADELSGDASVSVAVAPGQQSRAAAAASAESVALIRYAAS